MKNPTAWHIAVLIPARDEEELLPRCLRSIERARAHLRSTVTASVTTDVIVVSDCSTDRTEAIAQALLHPSGHHAGHVVSVALGTVGGARAAAAEIALARHAGPRDCFWLANTDADCEVPEDWLTAHLSLARDGVTAVAGIIDVDSFGEHDTHVHRMFRLTYLLHADGSHPHVHGANLGVRADAYLRAGGWSSLATAEDHDLWHRLGESNATRRSLACLRVLTSGRRHGRAPHGFADALAAHNGSAA